MEVASPLTFGHVKAGGKRRFPLDTPAIGIDAHHVDDFAMDDSSAGAYGQSFKRRRCDNNMEMNYAGPVIASNPFASASPFGSPSVSIGSGK